MPLVTGPTNAVVLPKMQHEGLGLSVVADFVIIVNSTSILVTRLAVSFTKPLLPAYIEVQLLKEAGSTAYRARERMIQSTAQRATTFLQVLIV